MRGPNFCKPIGWTLVYQKILSELRRVLPEPIYGKVLSLSAKTADSRRIVPIYDAIQTNRTDIRPNTAGLNSKFTPAVY